MDASEKLQTGCPVDAFLKLIGQRWNSYLLVTLLKNGPTRFGQLKKLIPQISQKVMTEKLRELEKGGILHRDYVPTVPPTVTYSMTPLGQSLSPLLNMISDIAHDWRNDGIL